MSDKKNAKSDKPKQVKFTADVSAVNCEKAKRVMLTAGMAYELVSLEDARKSGDKVVTVMDPRETHLGGDDGKTEAPCTLRAQVPAAHVVMT